MALTVNEMSRVDVENMRIAVGEYSFDSSYPTGGEAFALTGFETVDVLISGGKNGYVFSWDRANQKVLAYQGDNDNAADAPGVQVPDTTNLSAVVSVPFVAIKS